MLAEEPRRPCEEKHGEQTKGEDVSCHVLLLIGLHFMLNRRRRGDTRIATAIKERELGSGTPSKGPSITNELPPGSPVIITLEMPLVNRTTSIYSLGIEPMSPGEKGVRCGKRCQEPFIGLPLLLSVLSKPNFFIILYFRFLIFADFVTPKPWRSPPSLIFCGLRHAEAELLRGEVMCTPFSGHFRNPLPRSTW